LDVAARVAVDSAAGDREAQEDRVQDKDGRPVVTLRYRVGLHGKAVVDLPVDGVDRVDVGVVGDLGRRRALRL
jgi:hypothetical protein